MRRILNSIQILAGIYIFGIAGKSDVGLISVKGILIRVVISLSVITVLQAIKNVRSVGKQKRTSLNGLNKLRNYNITNRQKSQANGSPCSNRTSPLLVLLDNYHMGVVNQIKDLDSTARVVVL